MNIRYDPYPPGTFRGAGYWVDRAWQDELDEHRLVAKALNRDRHFGYFTPKPKQVHHHYSSTERCEVCHVELPKLNGKCRRCYQREYQRQYHKKTLAKEADAKPDHG